MPAVKDLIRIEDMTPIEHLDRQAKARPNAKAFIAGDEIWTYARVVTEVDRLARGLIARGVRRGDRVALHMTNVPELAIAYYACFRIGAIAAPLNIRFKSAELCALLQRLQPALYIGQAGLYERVAALDTSILASNARFVVGGAVADTRAQSWSALGSDGSNGFTFPAVDSKVPTVLLTTSGTTGHPKLVAHSLASLSATIDALKTLLPGDGETAILTVPMIHGTGLIGLLGSIAHGATIALLERFDADAVLDAIARFQGAWMFGLPFMFAALVRSQQRQAREVSSLRLCLVAGDVCPPRLQQSFLDALGCPLRNVWGMTETVGSLTTSDEQGPVTRIAHGAEVRLVDDDGISVPQGEVGEIVLRGPNMTVGYWLGSNRLECPLRNGWFHTGDLMRQDKKGQFWFVARKKDLIIRGGSNISPVEVESVLTAHPAVADAVVIGVPDEELGQRVIGFVRLASEAQNRIVQQIIAEIAPQLADYKMPERLTVVSEISRNALGKVDRKSLLASIDKV